MPGPTDDQWQELIYATCGDDQGLVAAQMDALWVRFDFLNTADPSGELKYLAVLMAGLDILLADAARDVQTQEGGGQSASWNQYFDHLKDIKDRTKQEFQAKATALTKLAGVSIEAMTNGSLTPVLPGYMDPGSPAYSGDPRYRYGARTPWPSGPLGPAR